MTTGAKDNLKLSHRDLCCRFFSKGSQEHLEICGGKEYEKVGLDMPSWRGILTFRKKNDSEIDEGNSEENEE